MFYILKNVINVDNYYVMKAYDKLPQELFVVGTCYATTIHNTLWLHGNKVLLHDIKLALVIWCVAAVHNMATTGL